MLARRADAINAAEEHERRGDELPRPHAAPVAHIVTQTPEPQRCPVSHCASEVQVQKPSLHAPVAPHWLSMTQVPQVPWTHAWPPPHWLFAVHAEHTPPTHARPWGD